MTILKYRFGKLVHDGLFSFLNTLFYILERIQIFFSSFFALLLNFFRSCCGNGIDIAILKTALPVTDSKIKQRLFYFAC